MQHSFVLAFICVFWQQKTEKDYKRDRQTTSKDASEYSKKLTYLLPIFVRSLFSAAIYSALA